MNFAKNRYPLILGLISEYQQYQLLSIEEGGCRPWIWQKQKKTIVSAFVASEESYDEDDGVIFCNRCKDKLWYGSRNFLVKLIHIHKNSTKHCREVHNNYLFSTSSMKFVENMITGILLSWSISTSFWKKYGWPEIRQCEIQERLLHIEEEKLKYYRHSVLVLVELDFCWVVSPQCQQLVCYILRSIMWKQYNWWPKCLKIIKNYLHSRSLVCYSRLKGHVDITLKMGRGDE